jgi:hypothetical protein
MLLAFSTLSRITALDSALLLVCPSNASFGSGGKSIPLSKENKQLLSDAIDKFHLSARAYHRILKVARTIADLENSETVNSQHNSCQRFFSNFSFNFT